MRGSSRKVAVVGVALALFAAACSTKGKSSSSSGGGTEQNGVKAGTGVTSSTITLGELTDLHGVFASLGKSITQADQLFWDQKNQQGGVCNRKIKLVVKDHGYDVQQAVTLYQQIKDQVLGLPQSLGSPENTALLPNFSQDKMLVIPASWASTLLSNDQIMIVGSTYDYEMINGIDYLVKQGLLKKGDKVGHIYFEGEYGADGLLGSKYAASKDNLTIVEQKIKATDSDVTAQVTNLKNAGVKAILLTAGPLQSASAAGVAASIGLNVPLLSNNPGWAPGLLKTPAAPALEKNFYIAAGWQGPASNNSAISSFINAYKAKYPGAQIDGGITWGYGASQAFAKVLDQACQNKDLTRDGLVSAFRSLSNIDTQGVVVPLDYSKKGAAPSQKVYIAKADAGSEGGLKQLTPDPIEADIAQSYTPPALKQ